MTATQHSPAHILHQAFIDDAVGVDPSTDADWQAFINALPDDDSFRHNALCVRDTTGILDGRIQGTGETVEHPGIQIRIRGVDFETARAKAASIATVVDGWIRKAVTVGGTNYTIQAFTRTGAILALGNEEQDRHRRSHFTVNGIVTILIV